MSYICCVNQNVQKQWSWSQLCLGQYVGMKVYQYESVPATCVAECLHKPLHPNPPRPISCVLVWHGYGTLTSHSFWQWGDGRFGECGGVIPHVTTMLGRFTVILSGICVCMVRKTVRALGGEVRGETEKSTVLPRSVKQNAVDIPVTSSHFNSTVKLKEAY